MTWLSRSGGFVERQFATWLLCFCGRPLGIGRLWWSLDLGTARVPVGMHLFPFPPGCARLLDGVDELAIVLRRPAHRQVHLRALMGPVHRSEGVVVHIAYMLRAPVVRRRLCSGGHVFFVVVC